jgi:hypothetical protein
MSEPNQNRYSQENLLYDGSVDFSVHTREEVRAFVEEENDPVLDRLQHTEVRYETTDHCNATCIMCPRDLHEDGRPHGVMGMTEYTRSIDEIIPLGARRVVLTGFGEPLMDSTLVEKAAYAHQHGLNTYMISNASLLDERRARGLIEAGLDELRVSVYGTRPETYNAVMQGLDFHKTIANLTRFLELREELKSKTPKLQVSYLVLEENKDDVGPFREYWEPRADAIEIWKPHNWGDGRDYRERHSSPEMKTTCGRPENGPLQIQWNGEVIPCCYDYNNQIILGNAFESSVLDVLNGEKYRTLRMAHRRKRFGLFHFCNGCDQLLPHADSLLYTNRHNLPAEEAVKLSNTDLFDLVEAKDIDSNSVNVKYADGLNALQD